MTFIKTTVEKAIKDSLVSEYFMYIKKKAEKKVEEQGFTVKEEHVNGCHSRDGVRKLNLLIEITEEIIKETGVHYKLVQKGKEFEPKHAETLFKDIENRIDRIKDEGIETTLDYRVDLMMYIEEVSVRNFNLNQRVYEEKRCPSRLLETKKDAYHEVFLIETGLGNPAMKFGNIMLKVIEENVEDQMTCTELLHILRVHQKEIFRSVHALISSSIKHLVHPNLLLSLPIENCEKVIKDTIIEESIICLGSNYLLNNYAISKVCKIKEDLVRVVQRTTQSKCANKDFIGTLFSNMKGLKKPHNDIEAYKMITVDNKATFAETLITQLLGPIHVQLESNIESWNVAKRKRLTEFVFEEMIGCLLCTIRRLHHFNMNQRRFRYQISLTVNEEKAKLPRTHICNEAVNPSTEIIIRSSNIFSGQRSQNKYNNSRFPRRRREKSLSKS